MALWGLRKVRREDLREGAAALPEEAWSRANSISLGMLAKAPTLVAAAAIHLLGG